VLGRLGQRPGLVEEIAMTWISPSGADEAEHDEAGDPRHDRRAPDPQNGGRRFGCFVPAALVELDPRTPAEMVEAAQLQAVLAAVCEPGLDVSGGEVVAPQVEGSGDEGVAR